MGRTTREGGEAEGEDALEKKDTYIVRERRETQRDLKRGKGEKEKRGRACGSVMLVFKCRPFRPLVDAIKRKKRLS